MYVIFLLPVLIADYANVKCHNLSSFSYEASSTLRYIAVFINLDSTIS